MKLALITSRFAPESSPGAKRAADLASALVSSGHDLTVLTQMPNYPDPAAFDSVVPAGTRVTIEDDTAGYTMWRFAPMLAAKKNLLRRLLAEARFAACVSRPRTGISGVDGVVASTPFIFNLVAARTYRAPMWLDVRDLTWEYVFDLAKSSRVKVFGARLLRSLALSSLTAARRISTTTGSQRQYLLDRGVPPHRVEVVPNGVPRKIVEDLGRRGAASPAGNGAPVKVVYAGLLGFPQGLEFAVQSVEAMAGDGIELHLFGDGVDRQRLAAHCRSRGLDHIHVHGHVSYDEYLDAIAAADVLLASLRPEGDSAMPSKIWEYMATGKPIVFVGSGEAARALATAQAGISIDYGDTGMFRERLRELVRDVALRRQLGANGREWVVRHRIREEINRCWVERIEAALEHRTAWAAPDSASPKRPLLRRTVIGTATIAARSMERTGLLRLLERTAGGRGNRLAVLTYHRIVEESTDPRPCPGLVSASPETFARQMAHVASRYRVVSMDEVLHGVRNAHPLPARSVLLTFDDAYHDFADSAWPVLKRHRLPVTLFVATAFPDHPERRFWWDRLFQAILMTDLDSCSTPLGELDLGTSAGRLESFRRLRDDIKKLPHGEAVEAVEWICTELGDGAPAPGVLGWDTLRSLARDGVTLGAHTRTHPLLDRVARDDVRAEVSGSLGDLRREIGATLPIFAYPAGHHGDEAVEVLGEEGIELAFTTRGGVNDLGRLDDPLRLRRIHVGPRKTRPILRAELLGFGPALEYRTWRRKNADNRVS